MFLMVDGQCGQGFRGVCMDNVVAVSEGECILGWGYEGSGIEFDGETLGHRVVVVDVNAGGCVVTG